MRNLTEERKCIDSLLMSLLLGAVKDLKSKNHRNRKLAKMWIFEEIEIDEDEGYSFKSICEHFKLNVSVVRHSIKTRRNHLLC